MSNVFHRAWVNYFPIDLSILINGVTQDTFTGKTGISKNLYYDTFLAYVWLALKNNHVVLY